MRGNPWNAPFYISVCMYVSMDYVCMCVCKCMFCRRCCVTLVLWPYLAISPKKQTYIYRPQVVALLLTKTALFLACTRRRIGNSRCCCCIVSIHQVSGIKTSLQWYVWTCRRNGAHTFTNPNSNCFHRFVQTRVWNVWWIGNIYHRTTKINMDIIYYL